MNHQSLFYYANGFRQLHTNFTHKNNQSPHKFILMLAVVALYEKSSLHTEKVVLNDELKQEFERQWALWVQNSHHKMNFGMPLYHMKSEPFWRFHLKPDSESEFENKHRMKTFSSLCEVVEYVELDADLVALFKQPATCQILKDVLLARLFEIL
ncbi:restriction endonuclease [Kingella kingae]|uniref:hypothetical protein n=1 Tax=Kingella TaxID=32257 RepID=UPI000422E126|nr:MULTISPECIES: hypothetical protein [Kingella]MDK4527762.1 restriction endonuclease [Kingella kingae]MDK4542343.1 restriction endonuclease [Kingella kingae]MDK4544623.1 restriction endonuclease [Kingella kingae]MDK4561872.1 restriction endonuclease [Kingella kingae]MDK4566618.1 restriction endonuclease [Kingella kingae]